MVVSQASPCPFRSADRFQYTESDPHCAESRSGLRDYLCGGVGWSNRRGGELIVELERADGEGS